MGSRLTDPATQELVWNPMGLTVGEWFDPKNPAHQSAAKAARQALEIQGKLRLRVTLVPD